MGLARKWEKALFLLLVSAVNDLVLVSETENVSARAKYSLSRKKLPFILVWQTNNAMKSSCIFAVDLETVPETRHGQKIPASW